MAAWAPPVPDSPSTGRRSPTSWSEGAGPEIRGPIPPSWFSARTVGEDAADAIREPFCLSDPVAVGALVAASFADVEVHRHQGVARFDSIESMVRAEIRGWTLSDTIDDEQYERMLAAACADLAFLTDAAGRVEFAMPALVATGRR
jgi:hypothetical protein